MHPWGIAAIAAFVVFDIFICLVVFRAFLAGHGGFAAMLGVNLQRIMALSNEMEQETERYLRANYSGDPTTLPVALRHLLDQFESRARAAEVPVSREELKPMLARLVLVHRIAESRDIQEAMKQVA